MGYLNENSVRRGRVAGRLFCGLNLNSDATRRAQNAHREPKNFI